MNGIICIYLVCVDNEGDKQASERAPDEASLVARRLIEKCEH